MKKLSAPMETMIREAVFHEVRQDGEIVRSGYIVAGRTGTVVALIDRGLATPADAENLGLNWLTEDGEDVYRGMMNVVIDESHAAAGPDFGDDVARAIAGHDEQTFMSIETNERPGDADAVADKLTMEQAAFMLGGWKAVTRQHGIDEELRDLGLWRVSVGTTMLGTLVQEILRTAPRFAVLAEQVSRILDDAETAAHYADVAAVDELIAQGAEMDERAQTWELPGDAERIWDMENAAAERASIDAENLAEWEAELAERAGVDRLIASLKPLVFTEKRIFVSKDLIHTTRRLRAEVHAKRAAKTASFAKLAESFDAICDTWDDAVSSGESTWQRAERVKRRLAASIRPTMGAKRKPSKPRR